ncbi:hypothetical protein V3C99_014544 [Haemonchus contortus]
MTEAVSYVKLAGNPLKSVVHDVLRRLGCHHTVSISVISVSIIRMAQAVSRICFDEGTVTSPSDKTMKRSIELFGPKLPTKLLMRSEPYDYEDYSPAPEETIEASAKPVTVLSRWLLTVLYSTFSLKAAPAATFVLTGGPVNWMRAKRASTEHFSIVS